MSPCEVECLWSRSLPPPENTIVHDVFARMSGPVTHASATESAYRRLVGLLTEAGQDRSGGEDSLARTLADVLTCAGAYFTAEEIWMTEIGCAPPPAHKARHDAFR